MNDKDYREKKKTIYVSWYYLKDITNLFIKEKTSHRYDNWFHLFFSFLFLG